jgi:hypothetical protein
MGQKRLEFTKLEKQKVNYWREKLIDFVNTILNQKFIWNERDCFSAICSSVDVMFDTNYYEQQLKYKRSKISALKYYKNLDVYNALKQIGFKEKHFRYAQTGDVFYSVVNGKECTAINLIDNVLMANEKDGFYVCKVNDQINKCKVLGI